MFRLTLGANGTWKEKVLHSFNEEDGSGPVDGLIVDRSGNFYGTTSEGGAFYNCGYDPVYGCGAVFELTPGNDGRWKEKVIHNFNGQNNDGYYPGSSLVPTPLETCTAPPLRVALITHVTRVIRQDAARSFD